MVVEPLGNSQYKVKLDGSERTALRNRVFLKRITTPYMSSREVRGLWGLRGGSIQVNLSRARCACQGAGGGFSDFDSNRPKVA